MTSNSEFVLKLLWMLSGPLIWAGHFGAVYIFTALACARGFADRGALLGFSTIALAIISMTIPTVIGAAAIIWRSVHALRNANSATNNNIPGFVYHSTCLLAALALVGVLWNALPALIVTPCR